MMTSHDEDAVHLAKKCEVLYVIHKCELELAVIVYSYVNIGKECSLMFLRLDNERVKA